MTDDEGNVNRGAFTYNVIVAVVLNSLGASPDAEPKKRAADPRDASNDFTSTPSPFDGEIVIVFRGGVSVGTCCVDTDFKFF